MRVAPALAAAAAAAVLLAGCGASAVIKSTTPSGSPFCTQISSFATQAAALTDAAGSSRTALLPVLSGIESSLKSLQSAAPANDTVNSKSIKGDIGTMASVYQDLIGQLQQTSDVPTALQAVNTKDGRLLTDAVGRFDDYAGTVCKVGQVVPSLSSTTTAAPSGASTTAGPASGPTAP